MFDDEVQYSRKNRKRHDPLEKHFNKSVPQGTHTTLARFYINEPMKMGKKAFDKMESAAHGTLKKAHSIIHDIASFGSNFSEAENVMHYAEFIHMMRTGLLDDYFPSHDWKEAAHNIHVLRNAFDTADVDGDDQLEQGEFEMVMDTLHMGHDLNADDMNYCWQVLLGASAKDHPGIFEKNSLNFFQFMVGVMAVKRDERLKGRVDLAKPNPWDMLSLLIDTPVSEYETERLMNKLSWIERIGIRMLNSPAYKQPMNRDHMKNILKDTVAGKLHYLSKEKIKRMDRVWMHCVVQAALIGFVSTGITTPIENWATWRYRSDGLMDIDCICYTRGCSVNPGSLPIPVENLAPGDVTIPGYNVFLEERFADEYNVNGTLVRHAWSLGPAAEAAWINGDYPQGGRLGRDGELYQVTDYDRSDCRIGMPMMYIPAHLRATSTWENPTVAQLKKYGRPIRSGGAQCERLPNLPADPRRTGSFLNSAATAEGSQIDECFSTLKSAAWFWLWVGPSILLCAGCEIAMLMYYGVMHSIRVAWALSYRLVPLNDDRAFLADSLVRAAFELGNPENAVFGVDPLAETGATGKARLVMMGLSWKGKIVITGIVGKFIYGIIYPWESAVWIKPWISMPADMFWNCMTAHIIMKQAQIRGVGVATVHEVFNEIMAYSQIDRKDMGDLFKIQLIRAVGVAIVKHGNMYPTMEILLRHCVQWLGMKASSQVAQPDVLDNEMKFLEDMKSLNPVEQTAVLSVHLLTLIIDGSMSGKEQELFERVVASVGDEKVAKYYNKRVGYLATRFRNFTPLTAEMVRDCFDCNAQVHIPNGWKGYNHRECMHWCTDCLTF
eukprot:COSAG01_NODE_2524_length_7505_cov_29.604915_5_plen_835_part_00